jgi:Spy/CpxP family protein refolding chaperone
MSRYSNPKFGSWRAPRDGLGTGLLFAGLLTITLIAGALLSASWAEAGWGRFGHGRHAQDPEQAREHAEFAAEWILRVVGASDTQQAQVRGIIGTSVESLFPLADQHRTHRDELIAALSGPTVDHEALERVRQAELELADTASRQLVASLAEIAEVLTPEQRTELLALAERFRH